VGQTIHEQVRAKIPDGDRDIPVNDTASAKEGTSTPLYVDVDGTLLRTDLLAESFFALVKRNLLYLFLIPFWLLRGRAWLKQQIAERVTIDVDVLPYHTEFLDYLRNEAGQGRELYLATASNEKFARAIADHLGCFTGVLASDAHGNLKGRHKLAAMLERHGEGGFDYAGNAAVDLKIWPHAREAILVAPRRGVLRVAQLQGNVTHVFSDRGTGPITYLHAIRVHQWLKNLLLFVPILTSHQWSDMTTISNALLGFAAFSLCASSVYLLNDLLDLPADRRHPNKRRRPFAAGTIPLVNGALLMLLLLGAGISIGYQLSGLFFGILLLYLVITLSYSLYLKSVAIVDVVLLAGLYTLRIIAGAAAIAVIPSFWLLAFSMFIFYSLALVKRCSELDTVKRMQGEAAWGRNYMVSDMGVLFSMGIASGYSSALVLALFINSPDVVERYSHPQGLWLLCPTIIFWVSHIWLKAARGEIHDDPLVFAIVDRGSQLVILSCTLISVLSL
jgi:4-hydroxybenzoate polyprenyltransferase